MRFEGSYLLQQMTAQHNDANRLAPWALRPVHLAETQKNKGVPLFSGLTLELTFIAKQIESSEIVLKGDMYTT